MNQPATLTTLESKPRGASRRYVVAGLTLIALAFGIVLLRRVMYLGRWTAYDTWTVVTAALAAMACALPGVFLVMRRQSIS